MAHIELQNVSVDIPIVDHGTQRLFSFVGSRLSSTRPRGRKETISALRDVSISLPSGTRLGVLGRNGSGKTTLLRLLSGIFPASSGHLRSDGRVTSFLDMTFGIEPELTGREAVILRSRLLGNSKRLAESRLEEIIEFSELGPSIDRPTRTYSSGMFLRLAFSISTFFQPEILIMDEWLSVGDKNFRRKAEERLQEIVQQTEILVVASHSRHLIEKSCSRAVIMEEGRVHAEGSSAEICEQYFNGELV